MDDWQPLDLVLANLPPASPGPEIISHDVAPAEAPAPTVELAEPELPFIMHHESSETLEAAPPPAERVLPPTASQKTKRKLSKIVIQPILPLEPVTSLQKKSRTGKTTL